RPSEGAWPHPSCWRLVALALPTRAVSRPKNWVVLTGEDDLEHPRCIASARQAPVASNKTLIAGARRRRNAVRSGVDPPRGTVRNAGLQRWKGRSPQSARVPNMAGATRRDLRG